MNNEKEERTIHLINISFPEKIKLSKGSKYLLKELINLIIEENPVEDHIVFQEDENLSVDMFYIDCSIKEVKKEDK